MEYLNRVLGIHVSYPSENLHPLPNYIIDRYQLQKVRLDGKAALFVRPKGELDSVNQIKKHLQRIESAEHVTAILCPDRLTYRQKEYLLKAKIPFIVDGKQIYLPFMRGDSETQVPSEILPSAQLLMLYYIYGGCRELQTNDAARTLGFTATSISRASRQLEVMGLVRTEKRGVQKVILADDAPKTVFNRAMGKLTNPVKKTIYIPKAALRADYPLAGYAALSEYTMLNPSVVECYASDSISAFGKLASGRLQATDVQCEMQLWKYDPRKLSGTEIVDPLSLALSLRDDPDERVEEAVEEMLAKVWEDRNGQRDG